MATAELRKSFIEACNKINQDMINTLIFKEGLYSHFSRNMHAFIHERIASIFVLIQNGCLWDADIILRSVAEASIKLIFVSLHSSDEQEKKLSEFWHDLAEINQLKQAEQAQALIDNLKDTNFDPLHIAPLLLSDEELERLSKKWTKKNRQRVMQLWSYNEMIKKIAETTDNQKIQSLNRNFTQSSHLIHADETALGVINDRKNRGTEEKMALSILHEVRLLNDSLSFYSESLRVIQ